MNANIEAVISFVAAQRSIDPRRITPSSTLFGDLGVDGDDGAELMLAFSNRFEVDLSEFELSKHFGPEGLPLSAPFDLLAEVLMPAPRELSSEERAGLIPISISDLAQAANSKRWRRRTWLG